METDSLEEQVSGHPCAFCLFLIVSLIACMCHHGPLPQNFGNEEKVPIWYEEKRGMVLQMLRLYVKF